jgi:hypothetical protein
MKKLNILVTKLAVMNIFLLMLSLSLLTVACKKESGNATASEFLIKPN